MTERASSTRESLLTAASTLLTQGGPEAVTLRAIGAAAGVSQTTPYRHFHDKDDLLSALAAETLQYLGDAMRHAADDHHAGNTALYRACLGYVHAAMQRPAHYRLVFGDFQINQPSPALEQAADDCTAYLYDLVTQAHDQNTLTTNDIRETAALIWATLHGMVDLTLSGHLREPRTIDGTHAIPQLITLTLQGLRPR